jgi:hypothetical protein
MAETIILKARVSKIEFADPIAAAADLATAVWTEQPLTLRDDEIVIADDEPDETEVFSHENDAAEDYDIVGKGTNITGSFIKATRAQLVELLGGVSAGADAAMRIQRSAKRILLNKAIKFTLKGGGDVIVPNAKGYVLVNAGLGMGGIVKYPFRFRALVASADWDCDIIL